MLESPLVGREAGAETAGSSESSRHPRGLWQRHCGATSPMKRQPDLHETLVLLVPPRASRSR